MMKIKHLMIFILLIVFSGCRSVQEITKYEYITKHERDSIYLKDSIFINQYTKGDTIFRDKTVIQIEYKDRFHNDTIIKNDTIKIPVKHYIKEKQKKHNWKFFIGLSLPIVMFLSYKTIKRYFLRWHS